MQLIESTGDKPILSVDGKRKIVISTPGAEPEAADGYSAVVILDAKQALNRDSLRASEEAVREWSNAIAKMRADGRAVIVGIPSNLGQRLSLWQQSAIARDELANRMDLSFPPHLRIGSIEGPIDAINEIVSAVNIESVQILGPISVYSKTGEDRQRLVLKYPYAATASLTDVLRAAQLKLTAGLTKTSATGRVSRAVRLRMDDPEVI
jgi:primosomal protein N' (replication factor Y)